MKVSEFIATLDSHSIYDADALRRDFEAQTNIAPTTNGVVWWPTYTNTQTRKAIQARGLGGYIKDNPGRNANGYDVAIYCARQLVPSYVKTKLGRGSAFWEAVEALREAGM